MALVSLFEACHCTPTPTHPEIIAFRTRRKEEEEERRLRSLQKTVVAPWIMWQPPSQSRKTEQDSTEMD